MARGSDSNPTRVEAMWRGSGIVGNAELPRKLLKWGGDVAGRLGVLGQQS